MPKYKPPMQAGLEDFKTGWYGLTLGVKADEIEKLIAALQYLKAGKEHFIFEANSKAKAVLAI
jgi:hypothetical protein